MRKEIKAIQVGEGEKVSLLVDDMFAYVENPQAMTKKLLELISDYNKFGGHKVNKQKSI